MNAAFLPKNVPPAAPTYRELMVENADLRARIEAECARASELCLERDDYRGQCAVYRERIEADASRLLPESCDEGCDACPPPKDCPIGPHGILADCVSDLLRVEREPDASLIATLRQSILELERQVEADAKAWEWLDLIVGDYPHGICRPREERACTVCNAVDDARAALAERGFGNE